MVHLNWDSHKLAATLEKKIKIVIYLLAKMYIDPKKVTSQVYRLII